MESSDLFEIVTPPSLALTVIRLAPKDHQHTLSQLNDLNRALYKSISARTDIMLTQTMLNDTFCIRFAVGAAKTDEGHIKKAYELLCEEAKSVLKV